jgi:hypothetical protein
MIKRSLMISALISTLTYLVFFFPVVFSNKVVYSGKDSVALHYQSRAYLYEKLHEGEFPFWTERILLGYPIHADLERGYLNVVNVGLIYLFGPFVSYKILHLLVYALGSAGLFLFLRKRDVTVLGFAAANLIYFFSFFHLYHQQHFNMVLTTWLFPFLIYLLDQFVSKKQMRYLILNALSLAFCFYLGSFQVILLILLVQGAYLFFYSQDTKEFFTRVGIYAFLFLALVLPALPGMLDLYAYSNRSGQEAFTQGSFSPAMFVSTVFPFLFNFGDDYMGAIVSRDYFMHETYVYLGVAAFIFSLFGFKFVKDEKFKKFLLLLVSLFLFLGFIKYVPLLRSIDLVPFSFFRYWIRSAFLFNFVVAVLCGYFISFASRKSFSVKLGDLKFILPFAVYLGVLEIVNFGKTHSLTILHLLARDDYVFGFWYVIWGVVVILAVLTLVFSKKLGNRIPAVACALVFVDLLVFGILSFNTGVRGIPEILPEINREPELENTRTMDLTGEVTGDGALLSGQWGVLGYSVLFPSAVWEKLYSMDFNSPRVFDMDPKLDLYSSEFHEQLRSLGVEVVVLPNGQSKILRKGLFSEEGALVVEGVRDEGKVRARAAASSPETVETYVRYYPGWGLRVNGKPVKIEKSKDGLFLAFPVSAGESIIELDFVPKKMYLGFAFSVAMLAALGIFVKKSRYEI